MTTMEVVILAIANEISLNKGSGNWDLKGIFNNIHSEKFPVNLKGVPIFARVVVYPDEYEKSYTLEFRCVDDDGKVLSKLVYPKVSPKPDLRRPIPHDQICGLPDTLIENPGYYQIDAFIDGQLKASYPFIIIQSANNTASV